jgi:hypothetical protein
MSFVLASLFMRVHPGHTFPAGSQLDFPSHFQMAPLSWRINNSLKPPAAICAVRGSAFMRVHPGHTFPLASQDEFPSHDHTLPSAKR